MNTTERQYPYRPKWTTILFGGIFFGVAAVVLFVMASGNNRLVTFNRFIELSPQVAAILFGVLGTLSLCFVVLAGILAYTRLKFRQRIVVTDTALLIPRSRWSAEELRVPFHDIVSCEGHNVGRQRFLKINYGTGTFSLAETLLPKKSDFNEIRQEILMRTGL